MSDVVLPAEDSLRLNRDRLLEALREAQVKRVVVRYEGGGDSGDVTTLSVEPRKALNRVLSKMVSLRCRIGEFQEGRFRMVNTQHAVTLRTGLADFALDWVNEAHGGWENNEGGMGTVTLDVMTGILRLEHTAFYTESHDYVHDL